MSNRSAPLKELLELHDTGVWGPEDPSEGISVLRSTNFGKDGELQFEKLTFRSVDSKKRRSKLLQPNDIILEKSGGGPKQPVGRVCRFRGHHMTHAFGNFTARLRANQSLVDPEYLFWSLRNLHLSGGTLQYQKRTSGIRNLEMKRYLAHPLPLPPLDEQRRIVAILNRAAKIERLKKQAQKRLREFIPALFTKMFGDPATNPMNWEVRALGDLCEMDRRTIKPDDPAASELRFVGVENVVSGTGALNFETHSRVGAQKSSAFRFDERHVLYGKLRPYLNKVATPDFAGRCSTELVPLLPRSGVNREFLAELLRQEKIVAFVNKSVTGSRMPRTDMISLLQLRVPAPSLDAQQQFAKLIAHARTASERGRASSETTRTLNASLMDNLLGAHTSPTSQ